MNQQILSQDEVDALLQGITGDSQQSDQGMSGVGSSDNGNEERYDDAGVQSER